ncbi:MAG: hypothetical protein LBL98_01590 [Ruminococcus sp.]|jgi:hypothetical protein|nr:hypothetical protein [Ruminococcus sp.]
MKIKAIILSVILAFGTFAFAPVNVYGAENTELPYFYSGFTDSEKAAYESLRTAALNSEAAVTITAETPLTLESMNRIIGVLLYYDPEHFNMSGITPDAASQTFTIAYRYDKEKYAVMKAAVDKRANEILATAGKQRSVYNKLITIHDEIIKNCRLDETATEKSSVYGALVDGRADSFGYAEAFCLIAGKAGIRSFVNIYTKGGASFARSTVYSDSFWYNIDCAKDDNSRLAANESYTYFMVPDSCYSDSSPYSAYFIQPTANAINNYYYKALKLEAANDIEAQNLLVKLITENPKKNTFRFSFTDNAAFSNFVKTVTETDFITDTLDIALRTVPVITKAADVSFNAKTRVVTVVVYYPDTVLSAYYSDTSYFSEEQILYLKSLGIN